MKNKLLLICPTKYFYVEKNPERVKYHILSLMSHVIDLVDVDILDLEVINGYPRTNEEIDRFLEKAKKALSEYAPDIVGVSCYTSYDYLCSVDLLRICHELFPQAVLVVGGYHPTAVPDDFIDIDVPVDYIIRGEGENALREILIKGGKNLPRVINGKPLDISEEKPLQYELYPYKTDSISIALSRGCFYNCAFCVQSDDFPNKYRQAGIDQIKDKIARAVYYNSLNRILFSDPYFGVNEETTAALLETLKKNYSHLSFWAETRVDRASEALFKNLSQLNFDLHFGVESLAEDTLKLMNKTKNPKQYNESFFRTIELCNKYGVLSRFGFIMNYPGETEESYQYTVSQLKKAVGLYETLVSNFHCNQYALYPGNSLYNDRFLLAKNRGYLFPNDGWWRVKEPNIRKRSENCFASSSIINKYGYKNNFWSNEILEIYKRFSSKFTYKAYTFFQSNEISESLETHYNVTGISLKDTNYVNQADIISKFRYMLKNIYYLYDNWLSDNNVPQRNLFLKLFTYNTFNYQKRILTDFDNGVYINNLFNLIEEIRIQLIQEYEENIKSSLKDSDLYITLLGVHYQITTEGSVYQINNSSLRSVSNEC